MAEISERKMQVAKIGSQIFMEGYHKYGFSETVGFLIKVSSTGPSNSLLEEFLCMVPGLVSVAEFLDRIDKCHGGTHKCEDAEVFEDLIRQGHIL